jgi:hypothetical protein
MFSKLSNYPYPINNSLIIYKSKFYIIFLAYFFSHKKKRT